ncbi:KamA family radical SAM protein [Myxococcota bacterium]|nr:KamA family radical SAM protein [Myxococcota bacterium]
MSTPWKEAIRGATRARRAAPHAPSEAAGSRFPFRAPAEFLALADPADPADPIARQVVPSPEEDDDAPGFDGDPVGDRAHRRAPGLIHKYPGRALLVLTSACAVHCRYCFRREFPYADEERGGRAGEAALAALAADPSVREVVLSGGDPLVLPDPALAGWVERLAGIPHLRRLRVHSRVPGVLPQRIGDGLLAAFRSRLPTWFVVHFNHPRELSPGAVKACGSLVDAGFPVLNQAVLLRGVNDDPDVLAELFEGLLDARVKPYYLHQLDRVRGAAHFEVPGGRALEIVEAVRGRVSGLAMPAFVRDEAGRASKTPVRG